jgi:para-aminobenzoate synthetase/4-amino-4-deoxychorismate lyase
MVVAMEVRVRFDDLVLNTAFELVDLVGVISTSELSEVPGLLARAEIEAARGRYVAGFVTYDAAPAFDAVLVALPPGTEATLPLAWFAIFAELRSLDVVRAPDQVLAGRWETASNAATYREAIDRIKEQIRLGWTYQVNFTERFHRHFDDDAFELYRQLATAQSGSYNAFFETDCWAVASASPECFFEAAQGWISSIPMKGTARRGRYLAEDRATAAALLTSTKERAENVMIVDLVRNDLGRVASFGSVKVSDLWSLEKYPTVWQLTSTISARLDPSAGLADVFGALFPCGSVTGAPKASTMRIISELEGSPRGLYCGAIGVVLPSASGPVARFAVAIRTATIDRRKKLATYGAGGGITYDSDAAAEWAELVAKSEILTFPASSTGLFETLRYEATVGFVNAARHLRRLGDSAAFFGIPFDDDDAKRLLENARDLPSPARIRVSLSRDGHLFLEVSPLEPDARDPRRLIIDSVPVHSGDARLFHKMSDRARYDAALARHPGADDVILVNERDEVTETTRANVAVLLDGAWFTPALECGLLPGVERERLLEEGRFVECVISREMCHRAAGIATVSSLRGWHDAVLVRS